MIKVKTFDGEEICFLSRDFVRLRVKNYPATLILKSHDPSYPIESIPLSETGVDSLLEQMKNELAGNKIRSDIQAILNQEK